MHMLVSAYPCPVLITLSIETRCSFGHLSIFPEFGGQYLNFAKSFRYCCQAGLADQRGMPHRQKLHQLLFAALYLPPLGGGR